MGWDNIYGEFLKSFERISQLYQQYAENMQRSNELYNELIKYLDNGNYQKHVVQLIVNLELKKKSPKINK